jgi:hypothetical protein
MAGENVLKRHVVPPSGARGMEAFTSIGYTPQSAIADVLDNSIGANATQIRINVQRRMGKGDNSRITIADNGIGMSNAKLLEAMQFGSDESLGNSGLNVFGLGMKSASLEIAQKLTVLSRDEKGELSAMSWDKRIQEDEPWVLLEEEPKEIDIRVLDATALGKSGTLLIWDDADLKLADPIQRETVDVEKTAMRIHKVIREHLALIFHRFIEGHAEGHGQVSIEFNGELIEAWNPFDPNFIRPGWKGSAAEFTEEITIGGQLTPVPYTIETFILNDDKGGEYYEASRQKLEYQGIYCYRLDRVVQMPDWLSFAAVRHNSQNKTRLRFEFDARLTKALSTDVKKTSIHLTREMFENMRPQVTEVRRVATQKYKKDLKESNNEATPKDLHKSSSETITAARNLAALPSTDRKNDVEVEVSNRYGTTSLRLRKLPSSDAPVDAVEAVDTLDGMILWEPYFDGNEIYLRLNKNHEFYQKFYLPCIGSPEAIEAIDLLLWSLARAELAFAIERDQFEEIREVVSRELKKVAETRNLPDLANIKEDSDEDDLDE